MDDQDGTFAFIHEASQIKYEYFNNCNLTEIGDPFAEQPYAVAVQQGSHLQEEISKVILELQKDRYFETLSSKYWNNTLRTMCPIMDDSEGITLRSLGGVFIATLVGLGIAMIVLIFEVYMTKKEAKKDQVQEIRNTIIDGTSSEYGKSRNITVGGKLLNVKTQDLFMTKASLGSEFNRTLTHRHGSPVRHLQGQFDKIFLKDT